MTDEERYEALNDEVFALYREQRYAEALALIEARGAQLPGWRSDLAHTTACLHAAAGDAPAALGDLVRASREGAWWHPRLLLEDDDLAGLHELAGFEDLVAESARRCEAAQSDATRRPPVVVRPTGPARAVLAVLHGAGQSAAKAVPVWSSAVEQGLVVVGVESSRLSTPTYRTWPDQPAAARDVATALESLHPDERALPVVAAGFSAGARAALLWALQGDPQPVAAVLAVAPAVTAEQVREPAHRPPGVVVIGAEDDLLADAREALRDLPDVRLEVVAGLGHAYPEDFPTRLGAALRVLVP